MFPDTTADIKRDMNRIRSTTIAATALLFMSNVLPHVVAAPVSDASTIAPGRSVGSVVIAKALPASLGQPTTGDAAMGRYENTYVGKTAPHYHLDILTRRIFTGEKNESIVVKTIRVESPFFHTASGIRPNSGLSEIRRHYSHLTPIERWKHTSGATAERYTIFDDRRHGIAFEIGETDRRSSAIYIHAPGKPLEVCGHDTTDWQPLPLIGPR